MDTCFRSALSFFIRHLTWEMNNAKHSILSSGDRLYINAGYKDRRKTVMAFTSDTTTGKIVIYYKNIILVHNVVVDNA